MRQHDPGGRRSKRCTSGSVDQGRHSALGLRREHGPGLASPRPRQRTGGAPCISMSPLYLRQAPPSWVFNLHEKVLKWEPKPLTGPPSLSMI